MLIELLQEVESAGSDLTSLARGHRLTEVLGLVALHKLLICEDDFICGCDEIVLELDLFLRDRLPHVQIRIRVRNQLTAAFCSGHARLNLTRIR